MIKLKTIKSLYKLIRAHKLRNIHLKSLIGTIVFFNKLKTYNEPIFRVTDDEYRFIEMTWEKDDYKVIIKVIKYYSYSFPRGFQLEATSYYKENKICYCIDLFWLFFSLKKYYKGFNIIDN